MSQVWDYYGDNPFWVVGALLAGLILGLLSIELIRLKSPRFAQLALFAGVCASLVLIFVMTFTPVSDSQPNRISFQFFSGTGSTWYALIHPKSGLLDPVGNVLLFIPIAVSLTALVGNRNARISLLMLTISIEISQLLIGYGRSAELVDIVLNYAGVEFGILLAAIAYRLKNRIAELKSK